MMSASASTLGLNTRQLSATNVYNNNTNSADLRANNGMFACGSRVKVPQFGDDERTVEFTLQAPRREKTDPLLNKPKSSPNPGVSKSYLQKISADLSFSDDVVEDRCMSMTNYSDKYFRKALDTSDIITPRPKAKYSLTRHNARGADIRHPPCNLQKRVPYKLKPLKRQILEKANDMHKDALQKEEQLAKKEKVQNQNKDKSEKVNDFFITQVQQEKQPEPTKSQKDEWDKYLMTLLSDTTAQWIVAKKTDPGQHQVSVVDDRFSSQYRRTRKILFCAMKVK